MIRRTRGGPNVQTSVGFPSPHRTVKAEDSVRRCAEMNKRASFGLLVVVVATVAIPAAPEAGRPELSEAIVYERQGDLYAVAVDGSRTVQLTKTRIQELEPAVSPDGRSIAYTSRRCVGHDSGPFGAGSWTSPEVSSGRCASTEPDGCVSRAGKDADAAWSPDGETIFFSRVVEGPYYDPCRSSSVLGRMGGSCTGNTNDSRGRRTGRSLNFIMAPLDPTVSPDGLRLAFTDRFTCETTDTLPHLELIDTSGRVTGTCSAPREPRRPGVCGSIVVARRRPNCVRRVHVASGGPRRLCR